MKGKRHTTEEKIRILRKADTGMRVQALCRWKKEFGMLEGNQARRLRELEGMERSEIDCRRQPEGRGEAEAKRPA